MMNIVVLGAGAWGTALAVSACRRPLDAPQVTLWARDAELVHTMQTKRVNTAYLPGVPLPHHLRLVGGLEASWQEALAGQDLIIVATPMAALRDMLQQLASVKVPVVWLCKGFEAPRPQEAGGAGPDGMHGLLAHEIQAQVAPSLNVGVLSGPSFAREVAQGQPSALVACSVHQPVRQALMDAFHGPALRLYANEDMVGVEVGGAVKNVLAIAAGLCDGLQLGLNARAALLTRGLAEMTRLGVALGARPETFMGLAGLGDLVLTATGDLSRNRQVGLLLAQGQTLAQAVQSLGHVAEGVYSARTVVQRAQALGLEMPIAQAVVQLLGGQLQPAQTVAALMGREPTQEMH